MTSGIPHPFEIFYSTDEDGYYIFVPDGCVLVNGVAATNDDVDNGNLALDFGETPPQKVYCHVSKKEAEEGSEEEGGWEFTVDGEAEKNGAKYNVLVATFGQSENDGQSYDVVCSAISLGGSGEIVGDYDGSETISGDEEPILITGHPGEEDAQGHDSHSGLQFLTVGARTDEETKEEIPPKIIVRIIDKSEDEDWAAHALTVTPAEGSPKTVHFLGSEDIDIEIPAAPEPPEPLEGSDYIDVDTAVSAKIDTPDPDDRTVENPARALLTHDTDQFVRSKKTFLPPSADKTGSQSNRVIVDGPNAKLQTVSSDGAKTIELDAATGTETLTNGEKSIVLDPSNISDESGGTIDVCDVVIDDEETGVQFLGTDDIDIGTKVIIGGDGIVVDTSEDGKTITISATGGASGFTGPKVVVVDTRYQHPYLQQHKERWEYENGLLKSDGITDLGWSNITQAVEETVNV